MDQLLQDLLANGADAERLSDSEIQFKVGAYGFEIDAVAPSDAIVALIGDGPVDQISVENADDANEWIRRAEQWIAFGS